ncbi:hypothetical protein A3N57_23180 [Enterobacter cloacae subsp. dissolvens]|uniref:O-antigen translocase n=1 Tax=Enterobacter cloacae TaxID=550 RepID=UPI0007B3A500|nr:O-antigen translocase [Enterobacter cloacae]KZQ41327.1 hypothetical protein A3N57_23180 [Enterobacter cloacae subsp. dissolvens]
MKKFLTVTLFSGLFTLLKMLSGFVIGKVVAIYTGPSGIAMIGQLQSVISILSGVVNAPVGNGVVRYTAKNHENGTVHCAPWWRASTKVSITLYLFIACLTIVFSKYLSFYFFSNEEYSWLIILACSVLPLSVANTILASILNGQQNYRQYIVSGMISVIVSTLFLILMTVCYSLKGALISVSLNTSIAGFVLMIYCKRKDWFIYKNFFGKVSREETRGILNYSLMAFTSALSFPVALLIARKIMISETGWQDAGQWQAVWKISEAYLAVMTIALSTYFMPKLSSINESLAIKKEVNRLILVIVPFTAVMALLIYLFRDVGISLLFTNEFYEARNLFMYQLIGDVVKIASFVYAYPMLAQGRIKLFISSEVFFAVTFIILVDYFVKKIGIQGANIAYMINYFVYLCFTFVFTNFINPKIKLMS